MSNLIYILPQNTADLQEIETSNDENVSINCRKPNGRQLLPFIILVLALATCRGLFINRTRISIPLITGGRDMCKRSSNSGFGDPIH